MPTGRIVLSLLVISFIALLALCWVTVRRTSWRTLAKGLGALALCAAAALWGYSRRPVPERGGCALPSRPGELGTICGVNKPEDLALVPELGWVVTAEFEPRGRLMALKLDDLSAAPVALWPVAEEPAATKPSLGDPACTTAPDPDTFFPHGISVTAATTERGPLLAVVTHAATDTLQLFELRRDPHPHAAWRGCIPYPEGTTGNDVALLRDGSLVATNFAPQVFGLMGWRYQMRAAIGIRTGDVLRWTAATGWSHIATTEGAGPNGVIASPDESRFYFADGGRDTVRGRSLEATRASESSDIAIGGPPDDLSVSPSGAILATVATFSGEIPLLCSLGGRECRMGWAVLEIDPESHAIAQLVAEPGRQIASATSALEVGSYVFIGNMADDRIGVYQRH